MSSLCLLITFNLIFASANYYNTFQDDSIPINNIWRKLNNYINFNESTSTSCIDEINYVFQSLTTQEWAQDMFDATGKLPSGVLKGNINSLGQFDQCTSVTYESPVSNKTVLGKYCLAQFPLNGLIQSEELKNAIEYSSSEQSRIGNINDKIGIAFNLAICVPDTCSGLELKNIIENALKNSEDEEKVKILVEDNLCSTKNGIPWDSSDWGALSFFIFFGVLVLLSTMYDIYERLVNQETGKSPVCVSFSLWTNTEKLFKINPGSMKCLNGIRALTMFWIMLGHRFVATIFYPSTSFLDVYHWTRTYGSTLIIGATVAVDTFLFLSGALLAYVFFRTHTKERKFNPLVFYLHRILRLTPALGAAVLMQATLFRHLGSGPFWPSMYETLYANCRTHWWTTMLYVQNYVHSDKMCPGHTWYLGVDMQIYILSPIVLIPLWKSRKYGLINLAFWALASVVTLFTLVFINKWPAAPFSFLEGSDTREKEYYIPTHMRLTVWIIGFTFGYYMNRIGRKSIEINKAIVALLWFISLVTMALVVFGMKTFQSLEHEFSHWQDSLYNCFARPAWACAVAWVSFACVKGYGGPVNWFLSLNIWEIVSRLSYCMYLLHLPIQSWFISMRRSTDTFQPHLVLFEYCGDIVFTIIIAYFMSLTFEWPIVALEKRLLHKEKPKNNP